jgi:XRE family transcriptional regulator, fatty acid utilization regulator
MTTPRIFAGTKLRALRDEHGLRQAEMAAQLGISTSYLSQIEHDDRPLTPALMERLTARFPLDWSEDFADAATRRRAALAEAAADPLFATALPAEQIARLAEQQPEISDRFVALHSALRHTERRLQMADEALANDGSTGSRLPWEEVRDWFHNAGNYVDALDRAAEELSAAVGGGAASSTHGPTQSQMERFLIQRLGVSLLYDGAQGLRGYDAAMQHLTIDPAQPAETQRFQLAHQLAALVLHDVMAVIIADTALRSPSARQLLFLGLANYAAGALLMPYARFRDEARGLRHDIDRLRLRFGVSFEQACHRLSTLQRPSARGVPFFFCRVDMAGNITKRHSATRLQFARFGGACPLWIVHEAVAIPDRILVQLAETPDGVRYISMAKGLVKPSGSFTRLPRRYAVALGCEVDHAREFVYADGLDLDSPSAATKIGIGCRICPREDCDQRAFPPSDREIVVNPDLRQVVPYKIVQHPLSRSI